MTDEERKSAKKNDAEIESDALEKVSGGVAMPKVTPNTVETLYDNSHIGRTYSPTSAAVPKK